MKRCIALLFIAFLAVSCSKKEKFLLRFQPEKGSMKTMVMNLTTKMGGMPMETKMGMTTEMKIANVSPEGEVEVEATYTHVMMNVDAMGRSIGFDSAKDTIDMNDPSSVAYLGLAALLNKPLAMKMDKLGKLTLAPDILSVYPDSLRSLLGSQGSSQGSQMFDNMFSVFPEEEIGLGDSWERESKIGTASGPVSMKATYTVDKVNESDVLLKMEGTFEGEMAGEMGASIKMTGTMTGTLTIDRKTGWTVSTDMVQKIDMNTMGMKMEATNTISITTK
ncbi:MAG TPA: hypothetical protein DEP18_08180 [Flavobacteriales bacterium]|nr:hypothetical protein [Flavobacteriales bacterium]HCA83751.1 hypothetical protein [Flavobacteriales bacterium]HRE75206.1 DUF6263 family protein [Flavobacteriales bacterium]HRE97873.1 DUF6263 family protein [Flavobacteriales bacterium]HRJ36731.1 DUF6263 family protein [Flavobacteriales bacterium]